jgi:hypothetical protein
MRLNGTGREFFVRVRCQRAAPVFSVDFREDEDYSIPAFCARSRSRTVVLLSERAVEAFSRLVLGIQDVLCRARRDWIIYFQHEEGEFTVWVYAFKIVVTEEHADRVRELTAAV